MARPDRTADVVVHLSARPGVTRALRAWCEAHADRLADRGVVARTDPAALRRAVPGLDLRSDHGRRLLRDHLADRALPERGVLWSTDAVLGPAYLHTGGRLHPFAGAGVAGVVAATRQHDGTPLRRHVELSLAPHAEVVSRAWVSALRHGHAVGADEFVARLPRRPSWVPLVRRLVRDVGPEHVTVRPPARTAGETAGNLLDDALSRLAPGHGRVPRLPAHDPVPSDADAAWTARAADVVLRALPHLRGADERAALRGLVERDLVPGLPDDVPADPLTPARADDLAARDEADLATISTLVEVR